MINPLSPMTKLDAVNGMLASIGQAPVNSLDVTGIRDVNIATLALDNTTREVLNRGSSFNTDKRYPLSVDVNGYINVPTGSLSVDPSDPSLDLVVRDNGGQVMLYDRKNHTFKINKSPVECDIIWAMDFEAIPQAARTYIATRAARIFQSQVIGSDILFRFTDLHETEAFALLTRMEARTKDRNIFRNSSDTNGVFFYRN